jgi:hypothetical protein
VCDIHHATTVDGAARRLAAQFRTCTFPGVVEIWKPFLGLKPPTGAYERELRDEDGKVPVPQVDWATEAGFANGANEIAGKHLFVDLHNNPLPDTYGRRKPDVALLHDDLGEDRRRAFIACPDQRSWRDINMTIQVKKSESLNDARDQVVRDADQIFLTQPGRRFVFGIGIKRHRLQFHVVCRNGVFTTPTVDIDRFPCFFRRLVKSIARLPPKQYGLWPEFCSVPSLAKAPTFEFALKRERYEITSIISQRHDIAGRGTCVYRAPVKKNGDSLPREDAVKVSFRDRKRMPERDVLEVIDVGGKKVSQKLGLSPDIRSWF